MEQKWQPIETHPKNNKRCLLYTWNNLRKPRTITATYIAKFTEQTDEEYGEYSDKLDDYFLPEGWYETIDNWDDCCFVEVRDIITHWIPLPSPPVEHKEY